MTADKINENKRAKGTKEWQLKRNVWTMSCCTHLKTSLPIQSFYNLHSHPNGFYWGHQCSDHTPQYPDLQYAVWQLQQEVTRPKARFKPTSPNKSGVDGGAIQALKSFVLKMAYQFISLFDFFVQLFDGPQEFPSLCHDVVHRVRVEADEGLSVAVDAENL